MGKLPKTRKPKRLAYQTSFDFHREVWAKYVDGNMSFNAYMNYTKPRKTGKDKRLERREKERFDKAQYMMFVLEHPGFRVAA